MKPQESHLEWDADPLNLDEAAKFDEITLGCNCAVLFSFHIFSASPTIFVNERDGTSFSIKKIARQDTQNARSDRLSNLLAGWIYDKTL